MSVQTNQILIDNVHSNLRIVDRDSFKNSFVILNNLLGGVLSVSVSGFVITMGSSEYQSIGSDGAESTENREKWGIPPVSNKYAIISSSTLNVSNGFVTDDFASGQAGLDMTTDYYVAMGIELRSNGKYYCVFGTSVASKGDALSSSNVPTFSSSAPIKRAVWILQKNASGSGWDFKNPALSDLILLPIGAGAGGTATDLVPVYKDASTYTIQSTGGARLLINGKYYDASADIDVSFDTSSDTTWYICLDSDFAEGALAAGAFVETTVAPDSSSRNPKYVYLGEYEVSGSAVVQSSFNGYSIREMISWANGLNNIKRGSEQKTAAGTYTFTHGLGKLPDRVEYRYWDNSASKFHSVDRGSVESSYTSTGITYIIPNGVYDFNTSDYFEVVAYIWDPVGEGFASPKSDDSTDWYTSTPANTVSHALSGMPRAVKLEFNDTVAGTYWNRDGDQYVNAASGGLEATQVTFDWTGLPALSANLKMKIHFFLSEVSAGAFEATFTTLGTVKILGDTTTVLTPDLILDSSHTTFATQVNALADNSVVYLKESVTITANQDITKKINFNCALGAKIICATSITSMVKFSADCVIDHIEIESQEDITNGIEFGADFIVKSSKFTQNAGGKTLTNTVKVNTTYKGVINGFGRATAGSITNILGSDIDGNSSITIV